MRVFGTGPLENDDLYIFFDNKMIEATVFGCKITIARNFHFRVDIFGNHKL